ncbi:hypothetical protein MGI18_13140 [Bacillus sp. OVS6]|nr:hypothetical protein MGI18_13140 [Bacillus sp. OVS6]
MSIIGLIMVFKAPWMAAWFTTDAEAIRVVAITLRIDAFIPTCLGDWTRFSRRPAGGW